MPRGPLPNPTRARRNAPAIPTTTLDAAGRKGRPPRCPYELGQAGAAWWKWAWSQPQALAWSSGDLYVIARRAELEDAKAALRSVGEFDLERIFETYVMDPDLLQQAIRAVVSQTRALAGGLLAVEREMREIDDRLGLTPKGLAALRWTIVAPAAPADDDAPTSPGRAVTSLDARRGRLAAG